MKSGFALLSTMISIVLGSILLGTTFLMYNNIGRTTGAIQKISQEDLREAVIMSRMQKDFLGLATMWSSELDQDDADQSGSQDGNMENPYFYSVNQGGSLDYLTFITTSSLAPYASTSSKFVRVVYRLQSDPNEQGRYRLMRKEMSEVSKMISDDAMLSGSFSELARGIRSMQMHYYYFKKQTNQVSGQSMDSGEDALTETSEWNPENEDNGDQAEKSVPYGVKVDITFMDDNDREHTISFRIDIVSDLSVSISNMQSQGSAQDAAPAQQAQPQAAPGGDDVDA